jgi:hypothetical protein
MTTCPRCTGPLTAPGRSRTTLSRTIPICGSCSTDEAVREAKGLTPIPPGEWPAHTV